MTAPTREMVDVMLRQLNLDREQSIYWRGKFAEWDDADQAIEAWLLSLRDWLPGDESGRREPVPPKSQAAS